MSSAIPEIGLSLRQPWAWLVATGLKDVENRVWQTTRRGPFLVHASSGMTPREYYAAQGFVRLADPSIVLPHPDVLRRGGFVGRASITGVIPPCRRDVAKMTAGFAFCECGRKWHMGDSFGFELADVATVPFVPFRALQRWFRVPDDVRETIARGHVTPEAAE